MNSAKILWGFVGLTMNSWIWRTTYIRFFSTGDSILLTVADTHRQQTRHVCVHQQMDLMGFGRVASVGVCTCLTAGFHLAVGYPKVPFCRFWEHKRQNKCFCRQDKLEENSHCLLFTVTGGRARTARGLDEQARLVEISRVSLFEFRRGSPPAPLFKQYLFGQALASQRPHWNAYWLNDCLSGYLPAFTSG